MVRSRLGQATWKLGSLPADAYFSKRQTRSLYVVSQDLKATHVVSPNLTISARRFLSGGEGRSDQTTRLVCKCWGRCPTACGRMPPRRLRPKALRRCPHVVLGMVQMRRKISGGYRFTCINRKTKSSRNPQFCLLSTSGLRLALFLCPSRTHEQQPRV